MPRIRCLPVLVVGLLCSLPFMTVNAASARGATPAAQEPVTLVCTTEPRPVEEILDIWFEDENGTPVRAVTPAETAVGSIDDLPQGEPADEETRQAVTDALFQWFVCLETGQYARAFGAATDAVIAEYGPRGGETREEARAELESQLAEEPAPLALQVGESLPQFDVVMLPDGRAGLLSFDPSGTLFFVFEQQDGHWLVDDLIVVETMGTQPAATPTG